MACNHVARVISIVRGRARGFTGRGEVWAFYLHPDRWGSGAAAQLMEHVEQRLKAEGFATVVLWVLDDNPLMQSVGTMFGGAPYKRYAMFQGEIESSAAPRPPTTPNP